MFLTWLRNSVPVHARHAGVRDDKVHPLVFQHGNGGLCGLCGDHFVGLPAKNPLEAAQDVLLVVHQKYPQVVRQFVGRVGSLDLFIHPPHLPVVPPAAGL
jgi:hypothetical protein